MTLSSQSSKLENAGYSHTNDSFGLEMSTAKYEKIKTNIGIRRGEIIDTVQVVDLRNNTTYVTIR